MRKFILFIVMVLFFLGCNEKNVMNINLKPDFKFKGETYLGILPLDASVEEVGCSISDSIAANLMQLDLRIIERTFLKNILEEQGLSLSGATGNPNYNEIGKIANVDYLLVGTAVTIKKRINQLAYTISVSARIVNVSTGETVISCNYAIAEERVMIYPSLIGEEIAKALITEFKK
jgi:curli biogenesis system outer membrane secretion channel CsgG